MTDEEKKTMQENVLAAIHAGRVKMRPKWHFVLRTVLLLVGILLVFLTSVFLTSFIIFALRQSGTLFVPGIGGDLPHFFMAIPWVVVLLALLFIVLLQIMIKKYSFGYGRPLLLTALVILVLAVTGGVFLEMTPLHRGLFDRAEEQRLPFAGSFYRNFAERHFDDVTIGIITAKTNSGYTIQNREGETFSVIQTSDTHLPGQTSFNVNDMIVVYGERSSGSITAQSIMIFTGEPYVRPQGDFNMNVPADLGPPQQQ